MQVSVIAAKPARAFSFARSEIPSGGEYLARLIRLRIQERIRPGTAANAASTGGKPCAGEKDEKRWGRCCRFYSSALRFLLAFENDSPSHWMRRHVEA